MVEERFFGLENIQDLIDQDRGINKITIRSTFLDDQKIVKKDSNKDFYLEILEKITEFSKKFPHTQFAVVAKKNEDIKQVEIHVKPIHGTA